MFNSFAFVFRLVLYVIIACMCAMLKIEDHFWTEFTINIDVQMHTMFRCSVIRLNRWKELVYQS